MYVQLGVVISQRWCIIFYTENLGIKDYKFDSGDSHELCTITHKVVTLKEARCSINI